MLCSAAWDRDAVRDDVRDYVVEQIGDAAGVLVADETGFVKKGRASAGVQRQYSGTAGKTENCQIGTFLCYATSRGRALIDRELYLPKSWTGDRDRCRAAAIPDEVEFATKPQQARAMLERAITAGVPFSWFTADEAYGQNPGLRGWLEEQDIAYVMATRCDDEVPSGLHTTTRVDELIARVRAGAWQRLSCGDGAHGPRRYDWARVPIRRTFAHGRRGWVLARRSISDPSDIAYYVCFGPAAPDCGNSCGSPVAVGRWRNRSRPRRTRSAWTSTRSAATTPGTATSPWPWPLPRSSSSPAPAKPQRGHHRQRGQPDPAEQQRDPPPVRPPRPDHPPPRQPHPALVQLPPPTPGTSPSRPLPQTTRTAISHDPPLQY
ncbi:DDE superfamily endonuclease [Micromonospora olivasterospora]|uniref:DDE superfamily endonuclease n=1 Tax=Micromonospora olivasterospora TaxID=1880 RepID=A0A562IJK7_MICOL|nr:DDE superfamily endonuclease [Micromonospora olivasterospora]